MRKIAGVLFSAALVLPLFVLAPPAGAVGGTTCGALSGTATFSPPLPKFGNNTKVKSTVTIKGAKLAKCVGGKVTFGTVGATLKFGTAGNCTTLAQGVSSNVKGTVTIVWNNISTKKSTVSPAVLAGITGKPPTVQKVSGPVSLGLFKGSKETATTVYTIPSGQCTSTALSKVTFKLYSTTKFVIK